MTATAPPMGSEAIDDELGPVPARHRTLTLVALAMWAALVVVGRVWGLAVVRGASEPLYVDAVPFYGVWKAELTWRLMLAALVIGGLTSVLPRLADRLGWRALLATIALASIAVGLALAFVEPQADAWHNIHGDYGQYTHLVDEQGPGAFLRDYAVEQREYPTHLSAHPPGMVLLLWAEGKVGLGNTVGEVGTAMAGVAIAAVAALVALRALAGEERARRAAAFLVIAPAAVWHTNADVVFGGIALAGLALLAVAVGRPAGRARLHAVGGGVLLGTAALFSHGLALMAVPALAVVVHRRRWREGTLAAVAALAVLAVPLLWGYSWLAGLASTKAVYDRNLARVRPYSYFVVGNLVAFAVAVGPATAVALAPLRDRATWVLVGGGLGAVVLADVSGLSLAETERIWQPFMPLVLLAGGALVTGRLTHARRWLTLQAVTAVVLVAVLRSPW